MWGAFVQVLVDALTFLEGFVGSYGLAIILFTLFVRLITLPLTLKQIRSSKAMQELQPKIKELQQKYEDDREKQSQEMMKLYREAGVNPAMGCLPLIIQMPIWFALYRALFQMADNGILREGWLFLPSLAEPRGIDWLTNSANWGPETISYLILPILTVLTQVVVQRMLSPTMGGSAGGDDDNPMAGAMQQMTTIMPLMFGFFALQVPSGLALYWVTSNIFQLIQQLFLYGDTDALGLGGLSFGSVSDGSDGGPGAQPAAKALGSKSVKGQKKNGKSRGRKRKKR